MASKRFLQPINLLNAESDPSSADSGDFYYNTITSQVRVYNGTGWTDVASGSGGSSGITVSETAPTLPSVGNAWFNNVEGDLFIYDGTYWVEATSLISLLFYIGSTPPTSPYEGSGWFDNTTGDFYIYDGHFWQEVVRTVVSTDLAADPAPALGADLNAASFGIENVDHLSFDTASTYAVAEGELAWNSAEGTLDIGVAGGSVLQVGQEFYTPKTLNVSGVEIPNGALVMATGVQGDQITVALAVTDGSVSPQYMLGVATDVIGIGETGGKVTTDGIVRQLDTSGWNVGDILYPDPTTPGGWTTTVPEAPAIKTALAIVLRSHAVTGRIYVRMDISSRMDDLDNVHISNVQNNETLVYNSSLGYWDTGFQAKEIVVIPSTTNQYTVTSADNNKILFVTTGVVNTVINVSTDTNDLPVGFSFTIVSDPDNYTSASIIEIRDDSNNYLTAVKNINYLNDTDFYLSESGRVDLVRQTSNWYAFITPSLLVGTPGVGWTPLKNDDVDGNSGTMQSVSRFDHQHPSELPSTVSGDGLGKFLMNGGDGSPYWVNVDEGPNWPIPDQTGNANEVLSTNGTNMFWTPISSIGGTWSDYSPVIRGTGWSLGNGTLSGRYFTIGKIGLAKIKFVFGSTSTAGSGTLEFSLPLTENETVDDLAAAHFYDASAARHYQGQALSSDSTHLAAYGPDSGNPGVVAPVTSSVPFSWATGDYVLLSYYYEIV